MGQKCLTPLDLRNLANREKQCQLTALNLQSTKDELAAVKKQVYTPPFWQSTVGIVIIGVLSGAAGFGIAQAVK